MKKWIWFLLAFIIVFLSTGYFLFNYAVNNILPYAPIRPVRVTSSILANYKPEQLGLKWMDFNITVEDSINLKGWYIFSKTKPAGGTVILLHGISNNRIAMLSTARLLAENGFNSILYDQRANGESGGINCTFGYYEKKDVSFYIDSAEVRFPGSAPYAIMGHSLGAAVSVQALAEDKRITCGIAVSPFSDLRSVIHDYFARVTLLRINSIPDEALKYSEQIAHFKVDSVKPALSAKKITQPVMIIHGLNDERISASYGKEIYDNLKSTKKIWYPVPGAEHNNVPVIAGSQYNKRILAFFKKYLSSQ